MGENPSTVDEMFSFFRERIKNFPRTCGQAPINIEMKQDIRNELSNRNKILKERSFFGSFTSEDRSLKSSIPAMLESALPQVLFQWYCSTSNSSNTFFHLCSKLLLSTTINQNIDYSVLSSIALLYNMPSLFAIQSDEENKRIFEDIVTQLWNRLRQDSSTALLALRLKLVPGYVSDRTDSYLCRRICSAAAIHKIPFVDTSDFGETTIYSRFYLLLLNHLADVSDKLSLFVLYQGIVLAMAVSSQGTTITEKAVLAQFNYHISKNANDDYNTGNVVAPRTNSLMILWCICKQILSSSSQIVKFVNIMGVMYPKSERKNECITTQVKRMKMKNFAYVAILLGSILHFNYVYVWRIFYNRDSKTLPDWLFNSKKLEILINRLNSDDNDEDRNLIEVDQGFIAHPVVHAAYQPFPQVCTTLSNSNSQCNTHELHGNNTQQQIIIKCENEEEFPVQNKLLVTNVTDDLQGGSSTPRCDDHIERPKISSSEPSSSQDFK